MIRTDCCFYFIFMKPKKAITFFEETIFYEIIIHCLEALCRSQSPNPLTRHWGDLGQKKTSLLTGRNLQRNLAVAGGTVCSRSTGQRMKMRWDAESHKEVWFIWQEKLSYSLIFRLGLRDFDLNLTLLIILHVRWVETLKNSCYILNMNVLSHALSIYTY